MSHENSRPITIYRSATFLGSAQGVDVQEYMAVSKQGIGSYWESTNSKRVGSGLTPEEQRILLPYLVEVSAEHPEFIKRCNTFFHEITTPVPFKNGIKLETGLEGSNLKPVSDKKGVENLPINIMDFVRWKHALKHPQVAPSKELAEGNASKLFYIFDKATADIKLKAVHETQDAAMTLYMEMKDNPDKVTMMLTLLGEDVTKLGTSQDQLSRLRKLAETKATQMMKIQNEGDIDQRYWLKAMAEHNIIKVLHNKYFVAETNFLLGSSLEEAVFFFKDEDENSEQIQFLKSTLQEKLDKKAAMK